MVLAELSLAVTVLDCLWSMIKSPVRAQLDAKKWSRIEREVARMEASSDQTASSVVFAAALLRADVDPETAELVRRFLGSQESRTMVSYVAVACLGRASDEVLEALDVQTKALMRLWDDRLDEVAMTVATAIRRHVQEIVQAAYTQIRSVDKMVAGALLQQATDDIRRPGSMTNRAVRDRAKAMLDLSRELPTDLLDQIDRYRSALATSTEFLSVPNMTVDGAQSLDFQNAYTARTIRVSETDMDEAMDLQYAGLGQMLQGHSNVLLLGDAGCGKSTEVLSVLHMFSRRIQGETRIPFRVILRHYAQQPTETNKKSIVDFLCSSVLDEFSTPLDVATLKYLLHTGRAVLLFDGLDEVLDQEKRRAVASRISSFCSLFPLCSYVVTSRAIGYDSAPVSSSFVRASLHSLDDSELRKCVEGFLVVMKGRGVEVDIAEFLRQTDAIDDIRRNPLLLGVLCSLYAAGRRLPKARLELYQSCSELLFSSWDIRRGLHVETGVDESDIARAVGELALAVFRSGAEEFTESWLLSFLGEFFQSRGEDARGADQLSRSTVHEWSGRRWVIVRAGVGNDGDVFRFSHRTFLEFYAAQQCAYESDTAAGLVDDLGAYLLQRNATVFCCLAVEQFARRNRSSWNSVLVELCEFADRLRVDGDYEGELNVLGFILEVVPSLREASSDVKARGPKLLVEAVGRMLTPSGSSHLRVGPGLVGVKT